MNYSNLAEANKQKETYSVSRKLLQKFEELAHWHCKLIFFELYTISQSWGRHGMGKI